MSIDLEVIKKLCDAIFADCKHFETSYDPRTNGADQVICSYGEREVTWCFMSTPKNEEWTDYTTAALNMMPALVAEVEKLRAALTTALDQWELYADGARDSVDPPDWLADAKDPEAELFRECKVALEPAP